MVVRRLCLIAAAGTAGAMLAAPYTTLAASGVSAAPNPRTTWLPAETPVSSPALSASQIFNDSARPLQPGVQPGAPVQPLAAAWHHPVPQRAAGGAVSPPDPEVLGFAETGEVTSGDWRADLNLSLLSTIAYDSVNVNSNGTLINDAGYQGWWSGQMTNLMNSAHAAGDRVVLVLTDFSSSSIESIVGNSSYSQSLIGAVVQQVQARGADGVNIDFEGGAPTVSSSDFTGFIAQLRSALRAQVPQQSYLTVDTYASSYQPGSMMNVSALSPYVDAFDVMAYDLNYGQTLPNAPLNPNPAYGYTDTGIVKGYLALVPSWQVILGVPYYGYVYSTSSEAFNAPRGGDNEMGAVTYSGALADFACTSGPPDNLVQNWAPSAASPWAAWNSPPSGDPCGGNHGSDRELYYDNAQSLEDKYSLVNSLGLRGIGIWALGYDSGSNDLWTAIASSFTVNHGTSMPPTTPNIFSMTPSVGPVSGGSTVTVNGYDFAPGLTLTFDGSTVPVSNITPTSFTFVPPAHAAGTVTMSVSDSWGSSATISYLYVAPSRYQPVTPFRILDTRAVSCVNCSGGALGPDGVRTLSIEGYRDPGSGQTIPATGVSAVVLNVTAVWPTAATFLAVNPTGTAGPATSTVSAPAFQNTANLVTAALGNAGRIDIWNNVGSVNVVTDVLGYYTQSSGSAGLFHPLGAAVRVCDTRGGQGTACSQGTDDPLGPGQARLVRVVDGATSISTGGTAAAVALNLTAVSPATPTYLSVYPPNAATHSCGGTSPGTSNLNAPAFRNQAVRVIVPVDPTDGSVCVYNSMGWVDFVVDVNGWFGNGQDSGGFLFYALGPTRICDSRTFPLALTTLPCSGSTLGAGGELTVPVAGVGGIPASGISALCANLTAISGSSATYLTADPDGSRSSTSDVNVDAAQNLANMVLVDVPADQQVDVYNALGSIDIALDAEGWFG